MEKPLQNRAEKTAPNNRGDYVSMRAKALTLDKDGKRVVKGQAFYAADKKQADKLIAMGRAELKDGKQKHGRKSSTGSNEKPA